MIHVRASHLGLSATLAAAALIVGCGGAALEPLLDGGGDAGATSDSPVTPPVDTGGPSLDAGTPPRDSGDLPFCPRALCAVGTVCCEYFQRCVAPDQACPAVPPPPVDGGPALDAGSACRSNADCPGARYCAGVGCGTAGTCAARPDACTLEYNPVCGCDGRTYGNACGAASAGVRVASRGQCGSAVDAGGVDAGGVDAGGVDAGGVDAGGVDAGAVDAGATRRCASARECGAGQECVFVAEACVRDGFCSAAIACLRPEAFCSCAGETYLSCRPDRPTSARGACAAVDAGAPACRSNGDCSGSAYCAATTCGGPGACEPRPEVCTREYAPVCGCDGRTYGNACTAASMGVRVASRGECATAVDAGSGRCNTAADCGARQECVFAAEACVRDGFCSAAIACLRPEAFCSCAGETYLSCRPDRPTSARGVCPGAL